MFCKEMIILHILARVKYSQTNGKMETPCKASYRKSVNRIRGKCVEIIARVMEEQECA